ncbi:ribbon-helix-helix domain-containing protein [Echinicola vietnamensis]|uniref:Putative transcriptional regulators containing the CopG/Arc/MetJ DNA-binding domain n=1 Tax=Echinicola vietnamensis (strain DSM 17526 / LMG 23754 / KMM 6221) TaxID=926556 RepID=L0G395_ECHVK|nr:transcriptional regulators containing the CopG/Arc/MetJ DNA-binding domain [Echinicola vietnamensis]AGA80699.1 putative transcriptional regulators containing the CopG/Arc/MetJ DNA-binding domain [Echinicola vietnamensis DSM 17526]
MKSFIWPMIFLLRELLAEILTKLQTIWIVYTFLTVYIYTKTTYKMARQTISVNEPNDRWMKQKIEGNEYSSKSELVNDPIRRQREQEEERLWLRKELLKGEESGLSNKSMAEILEEAKRRAKRG